MQEIDLTLAWSSGIRCGSVSHFDFLAPQKGRYVVIDITLTRLKAANVVVVMR